MNIFTVDSEEADVEELLNNVKTAVSQWESGQKLTLDLSHMLGESGKVGQKARDLRTSWQIDTNAIIKSNRPGIGAAIIKFQQFVRRGTWWFMEPIVQQIRTFQRKTAVSVSDLATNQDLILAELKSKSEELEALKETVAKLKAQLEQTK